MMVAHLEDGVWGVATTGNLNFNRDVKWTVLPTSKQSALKDGFRFFMEKEIYEQSDVVIDSMLGRIEDDEISFDEVDASIIDGNK